MMDSKLDGDQKTTIAITLIVAIFLLALIALLFRQAEHKADDDYREMQLRAETMTSDQFTEFERETRLIRATP